MDENTVRKVESHVPGHGKSRIPQANGLSELNPSLANVRSCIPPPGTIIASATGKSSCITETAPPGLRKPGAGEERKGTGSRPARRVTKSRSRNASSISSHISRATTASSQATQNGAFSAPIGARLSSMRGTMRPHTSNNYRVGTSLDTYHDDSSSTILRKRKGWDGDRMEVIEQYCEDFFHRMNQTSSECYGLKEAVELYKTRVSELETTKRELSEANISLRVELETMNGRMAVAEHALTQANRAHELAMDDIGRRFRIEAENIQQESSQEMHTLLLTHKDELRELKRRCDGELEDDRARRQRELDQIVSQRTVECQRTQSELDNRDRQIARLQDELHVAREELEQECRKTRDLCQNLETANSNSLTLDSSIRALKARVEFLESGNKEQSEAFSRLDQQLVDAITEAGDARQKLRKEETLRRKLHNQIQELRGNIRVFCRVRPPLDVDTANDVVQIGFPDEGMENKELSVLGPEERSSLGVVTRKNRSFSFDRVFGPGTHNSDVFGEISQLVQSALDGYNVCIFCYGQTGSGKTYTMSSEDGMIPRAVHQIYNTAKDLEEKGWKYAMEGNFVEVYNENLNDLLGKAEEFDKKRHEIRHDMQKCKTSITDITTVTLDSPEIVKSILRRATSNRSVAATKANERSSRSHSVFILKLLGENGMTGERSEGTLNLVDLAGSERLSHSGATGDRLKETQNINRSLSCLGDVINALGQEKEGTHIPYRNSKLTYLLQFSLGGNSKTLMFVMISPLQAHLGESLTSLKFATKVHNTHIGTAKRQIRVRDS